MGCAHYREKDRKINILLIGPDHSGKSTFLYSLDGIEDLGPYVPTESLQVYDIDRPPYRLQFQEVGGEKSTRSQWFDHLLQSDAIFFLIDVSDKEKLNEGLEELRKFVNDKRTQMYPFFVYFNKKDKGLANAEETLRKQTEAILATRKSHNKVYFVSSLDQTTLEPTINDVIGYFYPSCVMMQPKRHSEQ